MMTRCAVIHLTLFAMSSVASVSAGLPRSNPEIQGVPSKAILSFVEAADRQLDSLNSFILVRHGHVVAEAWWSPYQSDANHSLYSLSKSFTSTAVGIAIAEGKMSLDDEVLKYFPEDAPPDPSGNLKSMRMRDLLRMNTGHQSEPARPLDQSWTKAFLAHPVPFKPGTHFLYNTSATYMVSAMVQKATGQTVLDYLRPRLFEPLDIKNPTWESSPQGISTGGYGLSIRTEDIAAFGQLYLQKGRWKGRQLVSEDFIDAATERQTSNGSNPKSDWDQGYGYQFWRCRNGAYRGDGAFGQFCIVLPDQDAVIAITSGLRDMQAVLNLVWEQLLPAFHDKALPTSPEDAERLTLRLKQLSLKTPQGQGKPGDFLGKTFVFPKNGNKLESLTVLPADGPQSLAILALVTNGVESKVAIGRDRWVASRTAWSKLNEQPVSTSGAWIADNRLLVKICFHETPFVYTVQMAFDGKTIQCSSEANVGFGGAKDIVLVGNTE